MTSSLALVHNEAPISRRNEPTQSAVAELHLLNRSIASLCDAVDAMMNKLQVAGQQSNQLSEEINHLRAIEDDLRESLRDERVLSEEQARQLREAQAQIEFSTSKVNKLRKALEEARASESEERRKAIWTETARQEAQLRYENDLGLEMEAGDETEARLLEAESTLRSLSSKFIQSENEL